MLYSKIKTLTAEKTELNSLNSMQHDQLVQLKNQITIMEDQLALMDQLLKEREKSIQLSKDIAKSPKSTPTTPKTTNDSLVFEISRLNLENDDLQKEL